MSDPIYKRWNPNGASLALVFPSWKGLKWWIHAVIKKTCTSRCVSNVGCPASYGAIHCCEQNRTSPTDCHFRRPTVCGPVSYQEREKKCWCYCTAVNVSPFSLYRSQGSSIRCVGRDNCQFFLIRCVRYFMALWVSQWNVNLWPLLLLPCNYQEQAFAHQHELALPALNFRKVAQRPT